MKVATRRLLEEQIAAVVVPGRGEKNDAMWHVPHGHTVYEHSVNCHSVYEHSVYGHSVCEHSVYEHSVHEHSVYEHSTYINPNYNNFFIFFGIHFWMLLCVKVNGAAVDSIYCTLL